MGYETQKLKNGNLLVKDVPLMGPQKLTEKHFKVKDINRDWMAKGIETFAEQKRIGKLPLLWDRHNTADKAAQVIGRLDNLRIEELDGEPWYFADIIITDEAHQQKFLAGKTPSKSVEFQPDNYYLRGLALLDGHEGHFDYGIPDFVPEGLYDELVALGLNADCTVLCHSSANAATGATVMDIEQIKAAFADALKPVVSRIEKLEVTKAATGDIDADLQRVRDEEKAAAQVELSKIRRQAKIDAYAVQLEAKTRTPVALAKKKLASFQSDEAMDVYFQSAMKQAETDVKLGIEREHGGDDLEGEFAAYKARNPQTKVDFDTYKRLAAGIGNVNKDYGPNKTVIAVSDRGAAFVNA